MTTQIISSRAKLLPSAEQLAIMEEETRDISVTVEILWDEINWSDESDYVVSVQADEQMDNTLAETIASTADVVLSNTTGRFLPENPDSLIKDHLLPQKQIRISVNVEGIDYKMFTGYIKSISPDRKAATVNINCFDNSQTILDLDCPREAYSDQRADQIIRILAENAGLGSSDLELDQSEHEVTVAWFEESKTWETMGLVSAAERGRTFFNRRGNLRFWSRNYIRNQETVMTLTRIDHILNMNSSVSNDTMINNVIVKATPREAGGLQAVWDNGNILIQDQYDDPLVWIPAGDQQSAWIELADPAIEWTEPVANTDYVANTERDGTGTDLTGEIQILDWRTYGNSSFITVKNNSTSDAYFTTFQIRANPLPISKWIKVRQRDQASIETFGEKKREIENNYIDDEVMAASIAETELTRWKDSTSGIEVETIGIPFLHVGDVARLEISKSITQTVDQYQSVTNDNQPLGTVASKYIAQSFKPTLPYLTEVLIRAKKPSAGTFAGSVKISVYESIIGIQDGDEIVSVELGNMTWKSLEDDINYTVLLPFQPDLDKVYHLVFESSTANDINYAYIKKESSNNYYPNGGLLRSADGISWTNVGANHDLFFQWHGYQGSLNKKMIKSINWKIDPGSGYTQTMKMIHAIDLPTYHTIEAGADIFRTNTKTLTTKASIVPPGTSTEIIRAMARIYKP